ncbi:hypothetical protein GW17_00044778 [Ensete ventricosum]|nr:hypothetical protein GW17_00044778 [Ensete ventricosum]
MGPKCSPDHSFSVGQLNRVFQRRPFFKGPCMSRVSFLYPSSTSSLSLCLPSAFTYRDNEADAHRRRRGSGLAVEDVGGGFPSGWFPFSFTVVRIRRMDRAGSSDRIGRFLSIFPASQLKGPP